VKGYSYKLRHSYE